MNDEQTQAWIDEINRLHGTKLQVDDPLLILPTLNKILMQDNHEQLSALFSMFNQQILEQISQKIKSNGQYNRSSISANEYRVLIQACLQDQQQILQEQIEVSCSKSLIEIKAQLASYWRITFVMGTGILLCLILILFKLQTT